jgi:SAM-dependent methyltransferase
VTPFEWMYLCAEPFLPAINGEVRRRLLELCKSFGGRVDILDVGGRKSPYTIGLPAAVTISDLERQTEVQKQLNLGLNSQMIGQVLKRRSNVRRVVIDDMTCSSLPDSSFDCVVAVEVLEHVERDAEFLHHTCRVLRPRGAFLMTTPNGDHVPNIGNPDHKRHYTREQLCGLLSRYFMDVQTEYAVTETSSYFRGLESWAVGKPVRTLGTMLSNLVNHFESKRAGGINRTKGTRFLIGIGRKAG